MSIELRALGVKCNIQCTYCYQEPVRKAGGNAKFYDIDAMKSALERNGLPFTLFGGEPLLMPKADLEDLLAWGFKRFGSNAIQTNATLVDDDHVRMFVQYAVRVGVSIDGLGECNSARWAGSAKRTAAATAAAERAVDKLLAAGVTPSFITTLHRKNASGEQLATLLEWFRALDRKGIRFARIHLLEVHDDAVRAELALTDEENAAALAALAALERTELGALRFDLFAEIDALLLARDRGTSCTWRACDPYTTEAVQGVEGHGQTSNCSRTNKAGVDFAKADRAGYERYLALYETPHADGGCKGCRFFVLCKGQCPGTAIDGDWRNRTEHCATWYRLFEHAEARLLGLGFVPVSADPNLTCLERAMLGQWGRGSNPPLAWVLEQMRARAQPGPQATEVG